MTETQNNGRPLLEMTASSERILELNPRYQVALAKAGAGKTVTCNPFELSEPVRRCQPGDIWKLLSAAELLNDERDATGPESADSKNLFFATEPRRRVASAVAYLGPKECTPHGLWLELIDPSKAESSSADADASIVTNANKEGTS